MKVSIIGAGIGGLTLAIVLQQKGIDFEIFEAFPEFKTVGAGIKVANNVMQVYKKLHLYKDIKEAGHIVRSINITDHNFSVLSSIRSKEGDGEIDAIGIHRGELQRILLSEIPKEKILLNKKLISISDKDNEVELAFEDSSSYNCKVVVAADGIHSKVRTKIFSKVQIRDAHQDCWRGVTKLNLPEAYRNDLNELWGYGVRFGVFQISHDLAYWYALCDEVSKQELSREDLLKMFSKFHPLINEIISSTSEKDINYNKILDVNPFTKWYSGNIVLLGDAAHATTPNMGQGSCQAIEDAWVLGNCLANNSNVEAAFSEYQQKRIKKAHNVVNTSWKIGKIAHIKNPLGAAIRNMILKSTPSTFQKKQTKELNKINEF